MYNLAGKWVPGGGTTNKPIGERMLEMSCEQCAVLSGTFLESEELTIQIKKINKSYTEAKRIWKSEPRGKPRDR